MADEPQQPDRPAVSGREPQDDPASVVGKRSWSFSDLALDRPVTVGMTLIAVFLLGLVATYALPLAFMPSGIASRVRVRANITRSSPSVIEREVIRPLEEALAGIRDTKKMQVSSGDWGVNVHLEFQPGTDIDARKLEVRERLDRARADLPELVERVEISSSHGDDESPLMRLQVAGDLDLADRYYLIEREVVRPLERIPGVARVELDGVEPHELEVAVELDAVRRSGIRMDEVSNVVRGAHRARGLGTLRSSVRESGLRAPPEAPGPDDYESLPLQRRRPDPLTTDPGLSEQATTPETTATTSVAGGSVVTTTTGTADAGFARLGELSQTTLHPQEQRSGSRLNGRPAIEVDVFPEAGASTVDVSREVRAEAERIASDPTLGNLEVSIFRDQGEVILETLTDLRNTGIYGGLIGIVVLFAFLHRWRTTLIASACIPLSVLSACGVLFVRGEELNCIVLLGLVLGVGMLIDNAVVIVESIQTQLQAGKKPLEAARIGARQVGLATVASTMSSVIVFLPLIIGDPANPMTTYLRPLGATFVTALLASLFVSQTVVPLFMGYAMRRPPKPVRNPGLDWISRVYGRLIDVTLRWPRLTLLLGLCVCASAAYPATQVNYDLGEPEEQPEAIPVRIELTGSTSYEKVIAALEPVEAALLGAKQEIGISQVACDYRDWRGECDIYPTDPFQSEQEMSKFQADLTARLPKQTGVKYHINERDGWWGRGRDGRVVRFVVRGEDMESLFELSEQVAAHLRKKLKKGDAKNMDAGGYDNITGPFNEGSIELQVNVDPDKVHRLGLRVADVAELISLGFQGLSLGQARGPDGEITIRMSASGGEEPDIADLEDLRIPLGDGRDVPLAALATLEETRAPHWVQRVDRQTEIRMSVRFFADDMQGNNQLVNQALESFDFPAGYSAGEGSRWWGERKNQTEMLVNLGLCLLLVYAVMASLFESFLQPFAILVTCLLGCLGAPWAMWATGTTVDVVALIGLFILIGIVVNNGIMLVDKVIQLRADGLERDAALREAGRARLRPILMTASTTILGLVPMLIYHPTMAGFFYHSIAILIAGGLLTSTVVTLLCLPAAYTIIEDFANGVTRIMNRYGRGGRA